MTSTALEFTGERYTPECVREMLYEHYARYAMATPFARGKRVLDCACGEGYGSAMLADVAESVLGVDVSEAAVAHARSRYMRANLQFEQGDASALALARAQFDLVVSFETLEHLQAQEQMLQGFKDALKDGGALLISSPDKYNYSDRLGYQNPFHVKELYREEFEALLQRQFKHVRLFGQKLVFQSVIWDLNQADHARKVFAEQLDTTSGQLSTAEDREHMYFIALASDDAEFIERAAGQWHLFSDCSQSIYTHYQAEIRNGIYAAQRIAQLNQEIRDLKQQLEQSKK